MQDTAINQVTADLVPYPMEELARMRAEMVRQKRKVFDFGTGDPLLETPDFVMSALYRGIEKVSRYPTVAGCEELYGAHEDYLQRRFGVDSANFTILPTRGSKEAIFHIGQSIVGRAGRKTIAYPVPGYPVYEASIRFAHGRPFPVHLCHENDFLVQPWDWDQTIIDDLAAIWINYPHNPTGKMAEPDYLERLLTWCRGHDVVLLADECYVDIYDPNLPLERRPHSVLEFGSEATVSFFSLSKRSGMTGYRAGFMAGDPEILKPHGRARARFGLAQPVFIQAAAAAAWADDDHVAQRRQIFAERVARLGDTLQDLGLMESQPEATFYLWAKLPKKFLDDVTFSRQLADQQGVLTSPSSWLGDPEGGFFRMACVPGLDAIDLACDRLRAFVS